MEKAKRTYAISAYGYEESYLLEVVELPWHEVRKRVEAGPPFGVFSPAGHAHCLLGFEVVELRDGVPARMCQYCPESETTGKPYWSQWERVHEIAKLWRTRR